MNSSHTNPGPTLRLTIDKSKPEVEIYKTGITVEVRDYNVKNNIALWTDENGRTCNRYFIQSKQAVDEKWADGLERFAADLQDYAGVQARFERDDDADGLHVVRINNVDFYFYSDGTGYDGWGGGKI